MTVKESIISGLIVTIIGGIAIALFQFFLDEYVKNHPKISSDYSQKIEKLNIANTSFNNFFPLSAAYDKDEGNYYT